MVRDWKMLARALSLDIPEGDVEKIVAPLDGLESSFRPLAENVPLLAEPAVVFFCPEEEQ
ncbi:MAG: hypothetical protein HY822_21640 [Acidobacteria bacterium]|nr:hypothetical protein [Acidobacteriota bacterium]